MCNKKIFIKDQLRYCAVHSTEILALLAGYLLRLRKVHGAATTSLKQNSAFASQYIERLDYHAHGVLTFFIKRKLKCSRTLSAFVDFNV